MRALLSGRYIKRVLAQALAAVLITTSLPVNVLAAEDAASQVSSGNSSFESPEPQETEKVTDDSEGKELPMAGTDPDLTGNDGMGADFGMILATLEAGKGCFDLDEIIAENDSSDEMSFFALEKAIANSAHTSDDVNNLYIYVPEGAAFSGAVLYLDEDDDGTPEREIALKELPKPNRDEYEFVCWYLEEYESEDLSGLLSVNKITEETEIGDITEREDIIISEEKGIEIHAVWKKAETVASDVSDDAAEAGSAASGTGEGASLDASDMAEEDSSVDAATKEDSADDEALIGTGNEAGEELSAAYASAGSSEDELSDESPEVSPEDDTNDTLLNVLNKSGVWIKGLPTAPVTYTGAAITFPDLKIYNGVENDDNLIPDSNYTISYKNNKNAGTATVTVTFKNNYSGKISDTFTIAKAVMAQDNAAFAYNEVVLPYNGKAQKGAPVITYTGSSGVSTKLKSGTDYTLEYPNIGTGNEFIGTADGSNTYKIKVTGKGNFEGSFEVDECILPTTTTSISKVKVVAGGTFSNITRNGAPDVTLDINVTYNGTALKGTTKAAYDELSPEAKAACINSDIFTLF